METDAHLYEIFRDHPEWMSDLMNEPFPEPGEFRTMTEGKAETLTRILERRLGGLPKKTVTQIAHLDYLQLEKLESCVLDIPGVSQLGEWLRKAKRR